MTETHPHLPNAPIVEALIDIRVRLEDDFDVMRLREVHEKISDDYPVVEEQRLVEGRIQFGEAGLVTTAQGRSLRGFRVKGDEGRNIAQFRIDGFTFSRLAPYRTWKWLFEEGWRLWELYRETAHPLGVNRLATRFINRLNIPNESRLEHFFTAPPNVPDGVPDQLEAFLSRYALAPVDGIRSSVTLASEAKAPGPDVAPIILDIDCYVQEDLAVDADEEMHARFTDLRDMKNRIFFKSLTAHALEAFQ